MFTPEELKIIEKMPMDQVALLIEGIMQTAKRELFKFIEAETGVPPPSNYMLTHGHEFDAVWASGEDHSIASVWKWKGVPILKQSGVVTFDGVNISANIRTEMCEAI